MIITKNGVHPIVKPVRGSTSTTSVVYVAGEMGGASAEFVHVFSNGDVSVIEFGEEILPNEQYVLDHGLGMLVHIRVTGATGTTRINVEAGGLD
jgi:hypothetical protein